MPFEIKPVPGGYKVFKERSRRSYSSGPLTKKMAMAQMKAIYSNYKK